ncbi:MAG TPA: PadR family transcriptional regulator [Ktedonobacteraceae bacterium]|jgi:DNA-binding PadR family transcriptional regulator
MQRQEAYPITYSVLGLLACWGPLSGYDLKRLFDHVLAPMWGAAHSQIYNELRRMKELGWVTMEREEQETRPDRKVYQLTEAGRQALATWQEQAPTVVQLRDELLLKVLFGSFASPAAVQKNLQAGIALHEQRLFQYRQSMQLLPTRERHLQPSGRPNPYIGENDEDIYFRLVARFAIDFEKMYLQWLRETWEYLQEPAHHDQG